MHLTPPFKRERRIPVHMHAGVWIDHREAVLVIVTNRGEEMHEIPSNIERSTRGKDGTGSGDGSRQDMRDRKFWTRLNRYYDSIITVLRGSDAILIFGPGEAKEELVKRLELEGLKGRVLSVETVDKMSDREIAAKVRKRIPR
jgi:stalled ribosome rescue protein Dom34